MGFEFQSAELFGSGFGAGGIVTSIQVGRDGQTSFGGCRTDEVEDLLITIEGFTGPVFGNFGEESMLNGIPFGSASGIVSDSDSEVKAVGELSLEFSFPSPPPIAVAAAGIGQNQQLARAGVLTQSLTLPPVSDGVSREGGGVVRDPNDNGTAVGEWLVDTVGDGHADGVGTEVVIMDRPGLPIPTGAGVFEVADQFAFFSIDADDGQAAVAEALT